MSSSEKIVFCIIFGKIKTITMNVIWYSVKEGIHSVAVKMEMALPFQI